MSPEELRAAQLVNQQRVLEYQRAGILPQSLSDLHPDTDDGLFVYDSTGVRIITPSVASIVDVATAYEAIPAVMERDDIENRLTTHS